MHTAVSTTFFRLERAWATSALYAGGSDDNSLGGSTLGVLDANQDSSALGAPWAAACPEAVPGTRGGGGSTTSDASADGVSEVGLVLTPAPTSVEVLASSVIDLLD